MDVLEVLALTGKWYLSRLPARVPADQVLVHNSVRPRRRLNTEGARAWLEAADPIRLEVCPCGWASELGRQFRISRRTGRTTLTTTHYVKQRDSK